MITSDVTLFGIICAVIFLLFRLEEIRWLKGFVNWVPPLVICYLLMGGLNTLGIIDGAHSGLYGFATSYLLPPAMIYLTMAVDLDALRRLGKPSLLLFLIGTISIILGGAFVLLVTAELFPSLMQLDGDKQLWPGLATIAGSWIGGSASQLAAKEVFKCDAGLFSALLVVDTLVQNVWLAVLLQLSRFQKPIDRFLRADDTALRELEGRINQYQLEHTRPTTLKDFGSLLFVGFGGMALAHVLGHLAVQIADPYTDLLVSWRLKALTSHFFWVIVFSTLIGLSLSRTRLKHLEGVGAARLGVLFIYVVICTIGMQIDLAAIGPYYYLLLPVFLWLLFHIAVMVAAARYMRLPFFFLAVASEANIGGPASAGAVAASFSPVLTPVAVLLATLSNVIGSYGAIMAGLLMESLFHVVR